jgi:hypothetical protein
MSVPNIFATQQGNIPASEIDDNFTYVLANTIQNTNPSGAPTLPGTVVIPTIPTQTPGIANSAAANMLAVQASQTGACVNKFINGNMNVAQMGTSGSVTSGSTAFTLDGWYVFSNGGTTTWSQATFGGLGQTYVMKLAGGSGVTGCGIYQRIESSVAAQLCYGGDLAVTVTYTINNQSGGTITPTLSIYHATAMDNWAGQTEDVTAVSLQPCPNAATTTVSYTFAANPASYYGLAAYLNFGALTAGYVEVVNADIRATPGAAVGLNSSPPVFEYRPIFIETDICERYLQKSFSASVAPAQNIGYTGATAFAQAYTGVASGMTGNVFFRKRMRTTPAITTYSPSAASAQVYNFSRSFTNTSTATAASDTGFYVTSTGCTGSSPGDQLFVHWLADARL